MSPRVAPTLAWYPVVRLTARHGLEGQLGVALIDGVMDDWHIEALGGGRGNRLVMRKRIEGIVSDEANEA